MKRAFLILLSAVLLSFTMNGCTPTGYSNLLLFTDRLNDISEEKISLESYVLYEGSYSLIVEKNAAKVLITADENENGDLVKIGVTVSKLDESGKEKKISASEGELYRKKVSEVIYAFTLFNEDKSRELTEKILPLKDEDLLRTGELTLETENYRLVYYSNKLCCRFTVTDTYLEKIEVTEKPVSRALYGANL